MKSIRTNILLALSLWLLLGFYLNGQSLMSIEKKLTCFDVDSRLTSELQALIEREKGCAYYEPSLIWHISVTEAESEVFVFDITMQSEVSKDHKYSGYFHLDGVLFLVSGPFVNGLFKKEKEKILEFKVSTAEIPDIEDFSTWVYLYRDGNLFLKGEYPLPCD